MAAPREQQKQRHDADAARAAAASASAPASASAAAAAGDDYGDDDGAAVLPLPRLHSSQHGSSEARGATFKARVSNANGYLCRIEAEVAFGVPPSTVFAIMTHPDNSAAFRDIKKLRSRRILDASTPGVKVVEVEQVGAMRILWAERAFTTLLRVEEDARDPLRPTTAFELVRSDVLARFHGVWRIEPLPAGAGAGGSGSGAISSGGVNACGGGGSSKAGGGGGEAAGAVGGCVAILEQEVLPRGVPPFLARVPVLGGLLRGASLRAIKRLVEDMAALAQRIQETGLSVDEAIEQAAAERGGSRSGHRGREEWSRSRGGGGSGSGGPSGDGNGGASGGREVSSFQLDLGGADSGASDSGDEADGGGAGGEEECTSPRSGGGGSGGGREAELAAPVATAAAASKQRRGGKGGG